MDKTEAETLKTLKATKAGKATSNTKVINITRDEDIKSAVNTVYIGCC